MTEQAKPIAKPPKPRKPRGPKVTHEQWNEIEQAWAHGRFATMRELAEQFGVPEPAVQDHLKHKRIRKGQAIEEYNRKLQEELDKKVQQEAKVLADRIAETREDHYKMASGIAKLTWAEIIKAKADGIPWAAAKSNLQGLEAAMKVLKLAREERFAVLGLDRPGADDETEDVPELLVNELTQEQMDEMRQRGEQALFESDEEEVVELGADVADLPTDEGPESLIDGGGE
jgi:predicted DNA-binding protein YlxM (UPF0122 family)